jgi:hypothetical protein
MSPAIKNLSLEPYKAHKFVPSDRCGIEVRCGVGKFSGNESYCLVTSSPSSRLSSSHMPCLVREGESVVGVESDRCDIKKKCIEK